MKVLTFLLISINLFSQEIITQNDNYLIVKIPNLIKIVLENTKCDNVLVLSDNSNIKKIENCYFRVTPLNGKKTNLKIFVKNKKDTILIKQKTFIIKDDFNYKSTLYLRGQFYSDSLSLKLIRSLKIKVSAYPLDRICFDYLTENILSYQIILIKKNNEIYSVLNKGNTYNKESEKLLKRIEIGDEIFFKNIKMRSPLNQKELNLNPLSYKITK